MIDLKEYAGGPLPAVRDAQGQVKKTRSPEYDSPSTGLAAINLKPSDELIDVRLTDGKDDVFLVSRRGRRSGSRRALVRRWAAATAGVIGMRLAEDDEVIALGVASQGEELISVTQHGYGKRSALKDYPSRAVAARA